MPPIRVLHAGCGWEALPAQFVECEEVRLDLNADAKPDVVASLTDMGDIGPFDAVFCSHVLEHLHPYEVPLALGEFYRVLKPGGVAILIVPDLEDVRPTLEPIYDTPDGPVCGLDLYYGLRRSLQARPFMAHKTGFVKATMEQVLGETGFKFDVYRAPYFNLQALAWRQPET